MRRALLLWALAAGSISRLPADFSYRQTTTISGNGALGMAGRPGQTAAPGPMACTIAVKDGRLLARFADRATVIDPARETVTEIDFARRTYSVAGFDEIRRVRPGDGATLKPLVTPAGNRRQIAGFDAAELTMTLAPLGPETGPIAGERWVAPAQAGYSEIRDVLRRLSAAIEWSPWESLFAARPEIARILAALFRETAAADGMAVLEVTVIGLPPQSADPARNRLPAANPLAQWAGGMGSDSGPLFEIRTEMSGFSRAKLEEADFAVPGGFRRVQAGVRQPARR